MAEIFQFLYGTIKRIKVAGDLTRYDSHFNSSMVQLKLFVGISKIELHYYFNSSMVQLKDDANQLLESNCKNFNSSMVQLKGFDLAPGWSDDVDFNSSMVQLKVPGSRSPPTIRSFISIPLWYN